MLLIPQGEGTGERSFYRTVGTKLLKSRIPCYVFWRTASLPQRRECAWRGLRKWLPPTFWDATTFESDAIAQFEPVSQPKAGRQWWTSGALQLALASLQAPVSNSESMPQVEVNIFRALWETPETSSTRCSSPLL
jgi:hypothetical protein